jgi:type II secretory ATPase GspE/PulE/Tfp pilus assembly ATPase PilB-like protein
MHGRMPVAEMFVVDKDIQNIILTNPVENAIYEYARNKGFLTMKDDAVKNVWQARSLGMK